MHHLRSAVVCLYHSVGGSAGDALQPFPDARRLCARLRETAFCKEGRIVGDHQFQIRDTVRPVILAASCFDEHYSSNAISSQVTPVRPSSASSASDRSRRSMGKLACRLVVNGGDIGRQTFQAQSRDTLYVPTHSVERRAWALYLQQEIDELYALCID